LALAQAVYNTQLARFDNVCGGGLRWQAFSFLTGWNYKNSIANGCFFNVASHLALYTGNDTYAQHAISTWDWITNVGQIDANYNVFDGEDGNYNCSLTSLNREQFSYNAGIWLHGAAVMYNYTNGSALWESRINGLLNQTINVFFPNGIGYEVTCEATLIHCTIDMLSLKSYLVRWMAATTKLAPFTYDRVMAVLQTSAKNAALQCSGSPPERPNGRMCGLSWYKNSTWDGTWGVGQQMCALEVIQSNLIAQAAAPVTGSTGGSSQGDPGAGTTDPSSQDPTAVAPASSKDKAGAGILTAVVAVAVVGALAWVMMPDGHGK